MKKLIFLLFLISLMSCRTSGKLLKEVPVQTKIVVRERLVPVAIPADSSALTALFECDSLNQVQMKELHELKSKRVNTTTDFNQKTGTLNYSTQTIHDTIFTPATDSLVYQDKPYPVEVEKIVYEQTGVQKFLTILGGIALILLVIGVIIKFIK
ncbi:MAG: hypothetical protein JXR34_12155 [Bacteroidales bacterium]|nr:hypothetical protein [Bacteroidales bacterium]